MITPPLGHRVWLAGGATDMRKGFDGLAALVQEKLRHDPFGGQIYVFRGRRGGLIKVLWWDGQGLCLFAKRLEKGHFVWPSAADGVVAVRQLTALVGGAATTTITLRLAWNATGDRLLLRVDPATLPAERYKVMALRVGQSNEAANIANRDQDFTLEVSSGSRTAAFRASSLHRLLFPDAPPFGPAKIVMQTLRLPVARLVECGVDPSDLRSIAVVFDRRQTGVVYTGDLQFTN